VHVAVENFEAAIRHRSSYPNKKPHACHAEQSEASRIPECLG